MSRDPVVATSGFASLAVIWVSIPIVFEVYVKEQFVFLGTHLWVGVVAISV
jgi:hypothetical protein